MKLHPFWDSFPEMEEHLEKVARYKVQVLDESPDLLRSDLDPLLLSPGKMLRPAFVILSSGAGNSPSPHLYRVAAAVELLHIASLIHDDVIDKADERRGVPTIHSLHGVKRAVLGGDYLLSKALELASVAHGDELVQAMTRSIGRLCMSEIDQDGGHGDFFIDRDRYYSRINGKTAELFALSSEIGAVLGGASPETVKRYYEIGRDFGIAFQIEDDVLDYNGSLKVMGKPPGRDLKAGVPTLPLILALEKEDKFLIRLCQSRFYPMFSRVIRKRVLALNGDVEAAKIGDDYRRLCLGSLKKEESSSQKLFVSILEALKSREL